jgi:hypothetical protein
VAWSGGEAMVTRGLWDPSVDSGPNPAGAYGRVDGIIVTCKIVSIILKIYVHVHAGRVLTNKQT